MQKIDGKILFYYEITGCQNLVHLFEKNKFSGQDIESLFLAVTRIAETLDEYLLERNRILLHPAYVYQNLETGRFMFVWFPDSKKTMEEEFRSLTEYILPKINHEDKRAVAAGYGVYRLSVESYIDMEAVRQQIFSGKEAQKEESANRKTERYEENEDTQEAWKKEKQRQQILDRFYEEETEEKILICSRWEWFWLL